MSLTYWLPTAITLGRLFLVPVAVYLILQGSFLSAFWVFVVAGISDALDGALAKRFPPVAPIGAYLDPLADKALLVACTVSLGFMDALPMWLVIMIVSRDILIVGGAMLYHTLTSGLSMQPLRISKLNTVAQVTLVAVVLAELGLGFGSPKLTWALVVCVAATTLASGAAYVWTWGRYALEWEDDGQ